MYKVPGKLRISNLFRLVSWPRVYSPSIVPYTEFSGSYSGSEQPTVGEGFCSPWENHILWWEHLFERPSDIRLSLLTTPIESGQKNRVIKCFAGEYWLFPLSSPLRGRSLEKTNWSFPGIGSERIGLFIPWTDSLSGRDRDKAFLASLFRLLDALLGSSLGTSCALALRCE